MPFLPRKIFDFTKRNIAKKRIAGKFFNFTKKNIAEKRRAGKIFDFTKKNIAEMGTKHYFQLLRKTSGGIGLRTLGEGQKHSLAPSLFRLGGQMPFFAPPPWIRHWKRISEIIDEQKHVKRENFSILRREISPKWVPNLTSNS